MINGKAQVFVRVWVRDEDQARGERASLYLDASVYIEHPCATRYRVGYFEHERCESSGIWETMNELAV